MKKNSR